MAFHAVEDKRGVYLKYFLWLIALFAFFTYAHDVIKEAFTSPFSDFYHYFLNAKLLLQGYDIWKTDSLKLIAQTNLIVSQLGVLSKAAVLHSAGFFLLFSPFTFLSPQTALIAWVVVCQISFILSIAVIFKVVENADLWKTLCAVFLVFNLWPLREDLHLGQPNALILLLFSLSLLSMKHKKFLLGGVFLGLGIQIKELFLPMLLFCVCKKYWKSLAGAVIIILFVKAVSIFAFGIDVELSYLKHHLAFLAPRLNPPSAGAVDLVSLSFMDLWHRLSDALFTLRISQAIIIIFFCFALWRLWKLCAKKTPDIKSERLSLEFSFFVTFCFMISPWVHETHFIVLSLPLLACWYSIAERPARKDLILFIIAYLILGLKYSFISFPFFASGIQASLLAIKAVGLLFLFFLIDRLLRVDVF